VVRILEQASRLRITLRVYTAEAGTLNAKIFTRTDDIRSTLKDLSREQEDYWDRTREDILDQPPSR